jgi:proteasome lid subunit RPN8/RPN11
LKMETKTVRLSRPDLATMLAHVKACLPEEACGLLGGAGEEALRVLPVVNVAASATRFRMDPEGQVRAMAELEEAGLDLLAIYHSHPSGPATPSATDLEEAAYPDAAQLIWAPESGAWTCSAYRLTGTGFQTVEIVVAEEEPPSHRRG